MIEKEQLEAIRAFAPDIIDRAQDKIVDLIQTLAFPDTVVAISHSNYLVSLGGTEKVMHLEQAELRRREISYIQVYAAADANGRRHQNINQLVGVNVDSKAIGQMTIYQLGLALLTLENTRLLNVVAVHIHHLMHFVLPGILFLVKIIRPKAIRFFVHDYFSICPQFNLLKNNRSFCFGKTCDETCEYYPRRSGHFTRMKEFFRRVCPEVVAPSETASNIWCMSFPEHSKVVRVVPHLVGVQIKRNDSIPDRQIDDMSYRPRIAYVGYESIGKGLETWWRVTADRKLSKTYEFYHLGAAGARRPNVKYIDVSFLAQGHEAMVKALRAHRIDAAFLWSIWAETYCFTLFESLSVGCLVITNSTSGNIAARIRNTTLGVVLDSENELMRCLRDVKGFKKLLEKHTRESAAWSYEVNPLLATETAKLKEQNKINAGKPYEDEETIAKRVNEDMAFRLFVVETARSTWQADSRGEIDVLHGGSLQDKIPIGEVDLAIARMRKWVRRHALLRYIGLKLLAITRKTKG